MEVSFSAVQMPTFCKNIVIFQHMFEIYKIDTLSHHYELKVFAKLDLPKEC